jgi:Fe-S-cluster containining protein
MSKTKKLQALYSKIPNIKCKGLCHKTCTIVPAAKIEIKRAKDRMGGKNPFSPVNALNKLTSGEIPTCAALSEGRCTIYHARPAICRLYGVAEGLERVFGCKPEGKLNKKEVFAIIKEIEHL